ncbi:MAG: MgtC/SapB family protein [Spirosomataceae bacterium]
MMTIEFLPEDIYKLIVSFGIGAIIGFERELRNKSAGLRTMILISLGSTLFTLVSMQLGNDPSRIAANIVTGIGFIGGGIIFKESSRVSGITTAATAWVTAALGMSVGTGHYAFTIISMGLTIVVLYGLVPIENWINRRHQVRGYRIVCRFERKTLKQYEELFKQLKLHSNRGQQSRVGENIIGNWKLQGAEKNHEKLIKTLLNDPDVLEFDF